MSQFSKSSFIVSFLFLVATMACKENQKDSQDIPLESFRAEVTATPVKVLEDWLEKKIRFEKQIKLKVQPSFFVNEV
jgi:hypothetical protein